MSHENFARERRGVLQLLRPEHANVCGKENGVAGELIRVLGGSSGRDVDKENACAGLGYKWTSLDNYHLQNEEPHGGGGEEDDSQIIEWPQILPSCIYYLKLELVGELIDCGSHEVALCKVVSMISDDGVQELDYLSTRKLRDMGIISEFGRVVPMESKE